LEELVTVFEIVQLMLNLMWSLIRKIVTLELAEWHYAVLNANHFH